MRKFDVGDRVLMTGTHDKQKFHNARGTLIGFNPGTKDPCIEFDRPFKHGHGGNGICSGNYGYCWFIPEEKLRLLCTCNTLGCEGGCYDKV